jgi:hypothetical protein
VCKRPGRDSNPGRRSDRVTTTTYEQFKQYLLADGRKNIKQVLLYAAKYGYILDIYDASALLSLSPNKRHHAMEALANLSKYQGKYHIWKEIKNKYQLKWSNGDSFDIIEGILDGHNNYSVMVAWLKETLSKIPKSYGNVLIFDTLCGLRPSEAFQSLFLIRSDLHNYLRRDQMILEHYKYHKVFIRRSKKAFVSIVNDQVLQIAKESYNCGYAAFRSYLKKRGLAMNMAYCRKIHGTYLRKHGIESELVDLLHGRVPKTIFARHYFRPDFKLEQERIRDLTMKLYEEIRQ